MQPARIKPHAKEHTNNPVQRPNFRGHAAGDGEVTRACGSQRNDTTPPQASRPKEGVPAIPLNDVCPHRQGNPYRRSSPRSVKGQPGKTVEGRTQVAVLPRCVRAIKPIGCGCAGQVPRGQILHRHEHACSTSTSRHDTSNHSASCWPRGKSLHVHEHARRTGTHAT